MAVWVFPEENHIARTFLISKAFILWQLIVGSLCFRNLGIFYPWITVWFLRKQNGGGTSCFLSARKFSNLPLGYDIFASREKETETPTLLSSSSS